MFDPAGTVVLHVGSDEYDDPKLLERLLAAIGKLRPAEAAVAAKNTTDPRLWPTLPEGGRAVRVLTKNIDAPGERSRFSKPLGYDNLWIRGDEAEALARGELPESLSRRIARYHTFNSYTGEGQLHHANKGPDYVKENAGVKAFDMRLGHGRLQGSAYVEVSPTHYYHASLRGRVESRQGKLTRFDLVIRGPAVKKFFKDTPLERTIQVIAFRLADGKEEVDRIPPGFTVHNMADYLR